MTKRSADCVVVLHSAKRLVDYDSDSDTEDTIDYSELPLVQAPDPAPKWVSLASLGFPAYQIARDGRVRNSRGALLSVKNGMVMLQRGANGRARIRRTVVRLVAAAFGEPMPPSPTHNHTNKPVPVVRVLPDGTGQRFDSITDAAKITGIDVTSIQKASTGLRRTAGGSEWRRDTATESQ